MRTITLVGAIKAGQTILARKCSWCGEFFTPEDEALHDAGAKITHGMCHECAEDWPDGCAICGREIPEGSMVPLCRGCNATAQAAGKQAADAMRYPEPIR